jgi:hypothetical protein
MPSSAKKARGRDRKVSRDMALSLQAERKIHALETKLSKHYVEQHGRQVDADDAGAPPNLMFVPIELTPELLGHEVVRAMLGFVNQGILVYWELGHLGPHVAGRFKLLSGAERTIYSPDANPHDLEQAAIKTMHALREVL